MGNPDFQFEFEGEKRDPVPVEGDETFVGGKIKNMRREQSSRQLSALRDIRVLRLH